MKKKSTFVLLLGVLLNCSTIFGQNLVPNPSFNIQDTCPAVNEIWLAPPWNTPGTATPDLFNSTCGTQNYPGRTGIGSSGVYGLISQAPGYREYIQAPLTTPLSAGQTYCVTFYVKRVNYRYATNRMGAYFSNGVVNQSSSTVMSLTPQVENNSSNFLTSSNSWTGISGSFVATGGEDYITIGNFSTDAQTDTIVANGASTSKVSYYLIDDISVTACTASINELDFMQSDVSLYPIPATSSFTIRNQGVAEIKGYEIIDVSGKSIRKAQVLVPSGQELYFDELNLLEGIYFVVLEVPDGQITKRLVISK